MTAILPSHVDLNERVLLRCALGIRFRDLATNDIVRSGLQVSVYPAGSPTGTESVTAKVNHSGVWLLYGLPAVRTFELGTEDLIPRGSPPGPPRFKIEVEDEEGRFLPCTFIATASKTGPMEFISYLSSPLVGSDVPLFSAPSRSVPPGCAVIRTNLIAPLASNPQNPARWAMLEATTAVRGRMTRARGLANEKGDVALMFPWPELVGLTVATSPPGGLRLEGQGWEFEFAVWHDFASEASEFADLDAIFVRSAGPPNRLETVSSPPGPFTHATLNYGRELVVPENPTLSPPASDSDSVSHTLIIKH